MAEKILIVDDDVDTVKYLGLFITRLGYEPLQAFDGTQALKLAHEQHPDLIILDVMMPGLDGYEVARNLHRQPDTALIPILMFTARSQPEDKAAGYDVGVDLYLTKPVHPIDLQLNIKSMLAQHKAHPVSVAKKGYLAGVLAVKGGLGVSSVALNLAVAYRQNHSSEVVAVETRPGQGYWADELRLTAPAGLAGLLHMNRAEITRAAVARQLVKNPFGVPLLLASESCRVDCIAALAQYEAVLEGLSYLAELVVLDIGTNFHPAYEIFTTLCNEMVLVTDSQPLTLKRTHSLLADLQQLGFGSAKALSLVVVNRTADETALSASHVAETLRYPVALAFPSAPALVNLAVSRAIPLYLAQPGGAIARQFDALAAHIARHVPA